MKKSSSTARIVAVAALIGALILVIAVVSGAFGGGSGGSDGHGQGGESGRHASQPERHTPATYVVKSGDTLIGIAHENGVSVARIEALNPEVDPQILIAGEKLKLR